MSRKTDRNRRRRNAQINHLTAELNGRFGDKVISEALEAIGGRESYRDQVSIDITKVQFRPEFCQRFPYIVGDFFFDTFVKAEAFRRSGHFFWHYVVLRDPLGELMEEFQGLFRNAVPGTATYLLLSMAGLGARF